MLLILLCLSSANSQCISDEFIPYECGLCNQKCVSTLQLQMSDLAYLKSSTLPTALKSTFDMHPTFNNPYVCSDPERCSSYINYSKGVVVAQTNCTSVKTYTTCGWYYRVGIYEVQLVVMRLLNAFSNITKAFVQEILNYTGDLTVNCFNPQVTGAYYYKIDTIFVGVDLTTLPDYAEQYSRLINTLEDSISVLNTCLNDEVANQAKLQKEEDARENRSTKLLVAAIGACGSILGILVAGLGWLIKKKNVKRMITVITGSWLEL